MSEEFLAERTAIEQLEEGEPLIAYLQERFGWEFRQSVIADIPAPSTACDAVLKDRQDCQRDYDRLVRQCRDSYIIRDHFDKDHVTRRRFLKDALGAKGPWLKSHAKLSGNNHNSCFMIMDMLIDDLQKRGVVVDFDKGKLMEVYKGPPEYNQMSFDEKVAYVQEVDQLIYDYLVALSKATSEQGE